ncbi:MAG: threonylcarbamoyl-AMP synthase [Candidatus Peribacteraceae bacterium]|nr:threonylcarbamoyl-AMP synthase [Candidatus Peribacteraceae bacterium]
MRPIKILKADESNIQKAKDILLDGGIVAHATETCYGFACDMSNQKSIERLFKIKDRPADAPVSALFNNVDDSNKYVKWSPDALALANEHLPGPVTIILPIIDDIKIFPTPKGGTTLGIRVSPHPVALDLTNGLNIPLCTTSANIHRQPNTYSAEEICDQFKNSDNVPDLILDSGKLEKNSPSKVISFIKDSPQVLRS